MMSRVMVFHFFLETNHTYITGGGEEEEKQEEEEEEKEKERGNFFSCG